MENLRSQKNVSTFLSSTSSLPVFWDDYGLNGYSGVSQYGKKLSEAFLAEQGSITLVTFSKPNWWQGEELLKSQAFLPFSRIKLLCPTLSLLKLSQQKRSYVFHGLSNINLPLGLKPLRARYVVTIHDIIPILEPSAVSLSYYWQFKLGLKNIIRYADGIVCPSEWTKDTLLEIDSKLESRIFVIPNGWGQFDFRPKLQHSETIEVMFVSRFEKYKGFELVRDLAKFPDLVLNVVTDVKGYKYLKDLPQINVRTHVGTEELKELYNRSLVYIQPSRWEGFCLPVAEALSFGTPVVFLKGSGVDETAISGLSVGMTKKDKVDDWYEVIHRLGKAKLGGDLETKFSEECESAPTWTDAAQSLRRMYNAIK